MYQQYHKYSLIGKQYVEKITQPEQDRYPKNVIRVDCELDAINTQATNCKS